MFHNIDKRIVEQMQRLEKLDRIDRTDGTPRMERLRQIGPDTGKFLALLASNTPKGTMIEIGASAGYSALWLALACRILGRKLFTYELLRPKVDMARETFEKAVVTDVVELIPGDALNHLANMSQIAFCFLDAEKEVYRECYDLVVPNLVSGGILVADNIISHAEILRPLADYAESDSRVDSVVVPIGKGELVCRKV